MTKTRRKQQLKSARAKLKEYQRIRREQLELNNHNNCDINDNDNNDDIDDEEWIVLSDDEDECDDAEVTFFDLLMNSDTMHLVNDQFKTSCLKYRAVNDNIYCDVGLLSGLGNAHCIFSKY